MLCDAKILELLYNLGPYSSLSSQSSFQEVEVIYIDNLTL